MKSRKARKANRSKSKTRSSKKFGGNRDPLLKENIDLVNKVQGPSSRYYASARKFVGLDLTPNQQKYKDIRDDIRKRRAEHLKQYFKQKEEEQEEIRREQKRIELERASAALYHRNLKNNSALAFYDRKPSDNYYDWDD